jgi:hypothetical protein
MTQLKTQPNRFPTRKILAVIVSGAILGALQSGLNLLWPDHPFAGVFQDLDIWIQTGVMILAGYLTKDRK